MAPDLSQRPQRADIIPRYSDSSYVLGNSSQAYLQRSADLLTNGPGPSQEDAPAELPAKLPSMEFIGMAIDRETLQELPASMAFELAESVSDQPNAARKMNAENGSQDSWPLPSQAKQDSSSKNDIERSLGDGGSRLGGNFF